MLRTPQPGPISTETHQHLIASGSVYRSLPKEPCSLREQPQPALRIPSGRISPIPPLARTKMNRTHHSPIPRTPPMFLPAETPASPRREPSKAAGRSVNRRAHAIHPCAPNKRRRTILRATWQAIRAANASHQQSCWVRTASGDRANPPAQNSPSYTRRKTPTAQDSLCIRRDDPLPMPMARSGWTGTGRRLANCRTRQTHRQAHIAEATSLLAHIRNPAHRRSARDKTLLTSASVCQHPTLAPEQFEHALCSISSAP
ncbi:hypothetical protein A8924_6387 [Saccharopolyspora erythraea NRRL 2338]|nr:hypothetical protein A8924_6387 [Saccharopolyspora erythraea NRRL 2338]